MVSNWFSRSLPTEQEQNEKEVVDAVSELSDSLWNLVGHVDTPAVDNYQGALERAFRAKQAYLRAAPGLTPDFSMWFRYKGTPYLLVLQHDPGPTIEGPITFATGIPPLQLMRTETLEEFTQEFEEMGKTERRRLMYECDGSYVLIHTYEYSRMCSAHHMDVFDGHTHCDGNKECGGPTDEMDHGPPQEKELLDFCIPGKSQRQVRNEVLCICRERLAQRKQEQEQEQEQQEQAE